MRHSSLRLTRRSWQPFRPPPLGAIPRRGVRSRLVGQWLAISSSHCPSSFWLPPPAMDEDMLMKIVRGTCNDARFLFDTKQHRLSKSQEEIYVRRCDRSQCRFTRARFSPRVQRGSNRSSLRVSGTRACGALLYARVYLTAMSAPCRPVGTDV